MSAIPTTARSMRPSKFTADACSLSSRFKTAYVLSEQPPVNRGASPDDTEAFFDLYGGKPDIVGSDLADVVRRIVQHADREVAAC